MIFEWIKAAKQLLYKNGKNVEEALDEVNESLGKTLVYRDAITNLGLEDIATAPVGFYATTVTDTTYNIFKESIIYKPSAKSFAGAFYVNYKADIGGLYVYNSRLIKFEKYATNSNLEEINSVNGHGATSILEMCKSVKDSGIKTFMVVDYNNITDYPARLIDIGATAYPIIEIKKYGQLAHITVRAMHQNGTPYTLNGYLSGSNKLFWGGEPNSDLKNYLPLTGGNLNGILTAVRLISPSGYGDIEPNESAWINAPILSEASVNDNSKTRAGYGFHNAGANGAYLFFDTDFKLKYVDNLGGYHSLATAQQIVGTEFSFAEHGLTFTGLKVGKMVTVQVTGELDYGITEVNKVMKFDTYIPEGYRPRTTVHAGCMSVTSKNASGRITNMFDLGIGASGLIQIQVELKDATGQSITTETAGMPLNMACSYIGD